MLMKHNNKLKQPKHEPKEHAIKVQQQAEAKIQQADADKARADADKARADAAKAHRIRQTTSRNS